MLLTSLWLNFTPIYIALRKAWVVDNWLMQLQGRTCMVPKVDALLLITLKGHTAQSLLPGFWLQWFLTVIPLFVSLFWLVLFKPAWTWKEALCNRLVSSRCRPVSGSTWDCPCFWLLLQYFYCHINRSKYISPFKMVILLQTKLGKEQGTVQLHAFWLLSLKSRLQ